jgi:hypothetical protein
MHKRTLKINVSGFRLRGDSATFVGLAFPGVLNPGERPRFPRSMALSFYPVTSDRVAFKVAILVPIAALQQFQQRVSQGWIHSHRVSWMIAANFVTGETFFEQSLFVCATAVEVSRRCHSWRICSSFSPRIMPCTQGISSTVERTEQTDASIGAGLPRKLERGGLG